MNTPKKVPGVPHAPAEYKVYRFRGRKVMFDCHLAALYEVEPMVLHNAVRRHKARFPGDFMFQLTPFESGLWHGCLLRSQHMISKKGGKPDTPYVFTAEGVLMLASILKSSRAKEVNIHIIKTVTTVPQLIPTSTALRRTITQRGKQYDRGVKGVFDAIARLRNDHRERAKSPMGFHS